MHFTKSIKGEHANVQSSVLVASVIRLKTTVDTTHSKDLTWEWVCNGVWWLVYINFFILDYRRICLTG